MSMHRMVSVLDGKNPSSHCREGDERVGEWRKLHLVGIGGVGMSALASIYLGLGYMVSGSDLKESSMTRYLVSQGAKVAIGHDAENLASDTDLLVYSSAVSADNPELMAARKSGIPLVPRVALLAELMCHQEGIAVAGAHGKTTTTAMTAEVLLASGMDPTIAIGGNVLDMGTNARLGKGRYVVAEADESDGSFLQLSPTVAVVTNIEDDHLNHYGTLEAIIQAFQAFVDKASDAVVLCAEDPLAKDLHVRSGVQCLTYGLDCGDLRAVLLGNGSEGCRADVYQGSTSLGTISLQVPGKHNILNALAATSVALHLGLSFEQVATSLAKYAGIERRFQKMGICQGITVIDDYAHHPTEIKATLAAARSLQPQRLIAVFQPHRYSRTQLLGEKFGEAFKDADLTLVTSVYSAGEQPIPGVDAGIITRAVRTNGGNVIYEPEREGLVEFLRSNLKPGDLVITIGAGDIWQVGLELLELLRER